MKEQALNNEMHAAIGNIRSVFELKLKQLRTDYEGLLDSPVCVAPVYNPTDAFNN